MDIIRQKQGGNDEAVTSGRGKNVKGNGPKFKKQGGDDFMPTVRRPRHNPRRRVGPPKTDQQLIRAKERLIELTQWFFRIIDAVDDANAGAVTPLLAGILKEYDNLLCGSEFNLDSPSDLGSKTAVDARTIYVFFRSVRKERRFSPEQKGVLKQLNIYPEQIKSLQRAALKQVYSNSTALLPIFRKRYQFSRGDRLTLTGVIAYFDRKQGKN